MCFVFIDSLNLYNTFARKELLGFLFSKSIWYLNTQCGQSHIATHLAYLCWILRFLLWNECCVSSPKFICWLPNSQQGGIWRWGIWVVIRVRWRYEGRALLVRLVSYKKRHQRTPTLSTHTSWGKDIWAQGESPPQTSSLHNCEKKNLYCFKPLSLWYFVLWSFSIRLKDCVFWNKMAHRKVGMVLGLRPKHNGVLLSAGLNRFCLKSLIWMNWSCKCLL